MSLPFSNNVFIFVFFSDRGVLILHWNVWIRSFFASFFPPPLAVAPSLMLATGAASRKTPTTTATLADPSRSSPVTMVAQAGLISRRPLVSAHAGPSSQGAVLVQGSGPPLHRTGFGGNQWIHRQPLPLPGPSHFDAQRGRPLASRGPDPFQTPTESRGRSPTRRQKTTIMEAGVLF